MSWIMNKWNDFKDSISGQDKTDAAVKEYTDAIKNIKTKSVEDSYKEGRGAAGIAAADKAGQAKKQAKASTVMNGGNRLQAAVNGASAAADAASNGYDETANQAASMDQQADQARAAREQAAYEAKIDAAKTKQSERNAILKTGLQSGASALQASDKNVKDFKHYTYIPKDKRVKK